VPEGAFVKASPSPRGLSNRRAPLDKKRASEKSSPSPRGLPKKRAPLTEKRGFRKDEPFSQRAFRLESPLGKGFANSEPSLFRFGFDAILYLSLPPLGGLPERLALLVEGFRKRMPFWSRAFGKGGPFGRGLSEKDALLVEGFRKRMPFSSRASENACPFLSKGFRKRMPFWSRAFGKGCPPARGLSEKDAHLRKPLRSARLGMRVDFRS
jgi:hypothetical protein